MFDQISMVDLKGQYKKIKTEVDTAIQQVIDSAAFINGPSVKKFQNELAFYLNIKHVVTCGNGTDALQIALMALELNQDDEVIVPCFSYVATAEVIALLKLKPIMVEVDPYTFNITAEIIEKAITPKTKAIIAVHLFGQCSNMEPIIELARNNNLFLIEDTAQALGADYTFKNGETSKAGTVGHIGCTSFFPSKNLGCYGDGGAIFTNDNQLAVKIQRIANHGQSKKYCHDVVGVNSRLDTLQAAVLSVKIKYLNNYNHARNLVANQYDYGLKDIEWITIPRRASNSTHIFHQYTIKLHECINRTDFINYLQLKNIPSMVYYPIPMHLQQAFKQNDIKEGNYPVSEQLCKTVISLPIHTELQSPVLNYIIETIKEFKNG